MVLRDHLREAIVYQLHIQNALRIYIGGIPWFRGFMMTEHRKIIYFEIGIN